MEVQSNDDDMLQKPLSPPIDTHQSDDMMQKPPSPPSIDTNQNQDMLEKPPSPPIDTHQNQDMLLKPPSPPIDTHQNDDMLQKPPSPPPIVTHQNQDMLQKPPSPPPIDTHQNEDMLQKPPSSFIDTHQNEDMLQKPPSPFIDTHQDQDTVVPDVPNHSEEEEPPKLEITENEARAILEVIASTGKFWHEWDKLKATLSFQLKQVLLEYPEAKMTIEEQNASLRETFTELVKRLDEALHSFDQGPPFTLQRLCEILLNARGIYPNLSKLALALEKNLLVTSMLTISTDPYPQPKAILPEPIEPEKASEEPPKMESDSAAAAPQNGVEDSSGDKDEVMTEVDEADTVDNMTIDMEALESFVESTETNTAPPNS
ncbi:hypothetical protein F8388_024570 [Cannabis sativa]|uniref:Serine/threonine-protein phosphatase 4 regulatory subunit 2 n=1 Tax=Cannabis sativa TaxID=3483 RepID=A0A7J6GBV9_CANSA|nr:hypothetical protein F8388_024570 [Cannabis sativa]